MKAEVRVDQVVKDIMVRELGVDTSLIGGSIKIYGKPMLVNSSLTNPMPFGFYLYINKFLKELECLQCRALSLEFFTN